MRKIVSIIAATFLIAGLLCSCSGNNRKMRDQPEAESTTISEYDYSSFIGEWQYIKPNSAWGINLTVNDVRNNNEMDITLYDDDLHKNLPIVNNQVKSNDMINMNLRHNSDTYLVELNFYDDFILATVYSKERYLSDDIKKENELEKYVDEYRLTSDTAKPRNIASSLPTDKPAKVSRYLKNITNKKLKRLVDSGKIPANVEELEVEDSQITDITPLQTLTALKKINLTGNKISTLKPLQSLTNLQELRLEDCQISDITPLESLTSLTDLDLGSRKVGDVIMKNMKGNKIRDIAPLESLTALTVLNLNYNRISNLKPIQSLANLQELYLQGNQINDLTSLSSLVNLRNLMLWDNKIKNIAPLQTLKNLQFLAIDADRVNDIKTLKSLTRLEHLFAGDITQSKEKKLKKILPNCEILGIKP